jgi:hypothetical protein
MARNVYVIFGNEHGYGQMLEVWTTKEGAEARSNELDADYPNYDSYSIREKELHGA